ncbi:hypothetical protein QYE76_049020 [Lolium multiflorum]|uniref:DUF1639 family protein n=1 Tax=Lolium multiflorum TaxID=4521 RepID=A0AAD8SP71_LOLMU|nr:hypothetical protein QYE76_049020 [Lolium multiflorum]
MVISAEPPAPPLPASDPAAAEGGADAAEGGAAAAAEAASDTTTSSARRGALSSFPSSTLKTWGSHRVLRCAAVNRAGDAIAPAASRRSSSQQLDEVREDLLLGLREVAAAGAPPPTGGTGAAEEHEKESPEEATPRPRPRRARGRRRPATSPSAAAAATVSPSPSQRRLVRADALDRPRFSATLSADEIEEDVYALTGARPRRRPRRRPHAVQRQLDMLLPGAWLSEITAESYRVPDDR